MHIKISIYEWSQNWNFPIESNHDSGKKLEILNCFFWSRIGRERVRGLVMFFIENKAFLEFKNIDFGNFPRLK